MDEICKQIRRMTVECIGSIGSGHIGGFAALSEEDVANIYRLML